MAWNGKRVPYREQESLKLNEIVLSCLISLVVYVFVCAACVSLKLCICIKLIACMGLLWSCWSALGLLWDCSMETLGAWAVLGLLWRCSAALEMFFCCRAAVGLLWSCSGAALGLL